MRDSSLGWGARAITERLSFLLGIALVVGACSNAPATRPTYYLVTITSGNATQQAATERVMRLAPVELAPYLGVEGIVVQTSETTVEQARQHLWAEDLASQIQRDLRRGLSSRLPGLRVVPPGGTLPEKGASTLSVTVESFQGRFDGYAVVAGDWRLRGPDGATRASGSFNQEQALASDGYRALVNSLQVAWRGALSAIAQGLRGHRELAADSG